MPILLLQEVCQGSQKKDLMLLQGVEKKAG